VVCWLPGFEKGTKLKVQVSSFKIQGTGFKVKANDSEKQDIRKKWQKQAACNDF